MLTVPWKISPGHGGNRRLGLDARALESLEIQAHPPHLLSTPPAVGGFWRPHALRVQARCAAAFHLQREVVSLFSGPGASHHLGPRAASQVLLRAGPSTTSLIVSPRVSDEPWESSHSRKASGLLRRRPHCRPLAPVSAVSAAFHSNQAAQKAGSNSPRARCKLSTIKQIVGSCASDLYPQPRDLGGRRGWPGRLRFLGVDLIELGNCPPQSQWVIRAGLIGRAGGTDPFSSPLQPVATGRSRGVVTLAPPRRRPATGMQFARKHLTLIGAIGAGFPPAVL